MATKKNGQLWVRLPQRPRGNYLSGIPALLAATVSILALGELTGFSALYTPLIMVLAGCGVCITFILLRAVGKGRWFFPAVLSLLLILSLVFGKQMLGGFCLAWNRLGAVWTEKNGMVLPMLQSDGTEGDMLVFCVFMGVGIGAIACLLTGRTPPVLACVISGLLLVLMTVFKENAGFVYLLPVLLVSVLLLLFDGSVGGKRSGRGLCSRLLAVAVFCLILLPFFTLPAVRDYGEEISTQLRRKLHIHRYETEFSTLPEGDFTDYRSSDDTEYPALVVSMDDLEEMYLRGFTGTEFAGNRWTALEGPALAENRELLYWLNLNAFHLNAQYEQAVFLEEPMRNTVTVQNIGACSSYLYVPYNLCADSSLCAEDLNTGGVPGDNRRIYIFSTVGSREQMGMVLECLQNSDEKAVLDYRRAESAYREFVYSNYLRIPRDTMEALQPVWEQVAAGYGGVENLTRDQAQECALRVLAYCFPEEGIRGDVALPLENAAGSSYQYATTAVLTLRYFGIPARYAEGYVITGQILDAAEDGSLEVTSTHAQGWAEVYHDGIGWIPMALTPGAENLPLGVGTGQGEGYGSVQEPEEGKELEEDTQKPLEEPQPDGGYTVSLPELLRRSVPWGLGVLLLTMAVLMLRRRLLLRRRQELFDSGSKKEAIGWICAEVLLILEKMGISRGTGSLYDLADRVRHDFGDDFAEKFTQLAALNSQALFSSREMDENQREYAAACHGLAVQQLKSRKKWYQKLWMQWILCLY